VSPPRRGLLGTALALLLGWLLFRRSASYAIAPLDAVVAAADRTAAGHLGERLEPDDPTTRLGRMAAAYDRMLDSLEAALADTQAAEATSRRFLADAAHQLRTPLAASRSSVEALLREDDPETRDRLLANVMPRGRPRRPAAHGAADPRPARPGRRPPEPVPTDLAALCHDEVERAASLAPHLTVTCHGRRRTPVPLRPARGSSIPRPPARSSPTSSTTPAGTPLPHRPRGSGPPRTTVRPTAWCCGSRTTARGSRPMPSPRVFERFVSLDGQGGSGLGLPIARTLARAQGGELEYRDDAFVLALPARPAGS
jgi:two-component system, OmpR family, sensor kinase